MKPEQGAAAIRELVDRLTGDELSEAHARAMLESAQRSAAMRPTPQAGIAASGVAVQGSIISTGDGLPAELFWGSERGSSLYRQFGPRRSERGFWMFPAFDSPDTLSESERAIAEILESVT